MLETILIPINDTLQSESAIQQATLLAKAFSARVHLLGIVQHDEPANVNQYADPVLWKAVKDQKQAALAALATELENQNIRVKLAMMDSSSLDTFLHYVQEKSFDLIVFAEDDQKTRALLRDVLTHTSIPVFVARTKPQSYRRVLLPLDCSQRAECMVPLATLLAHSMDATLVLAHVVKKPDMPRMTALNAEDVQLTEQLVERQRQEGERYLKDLSERLPVATEIQIVAHNSITTALQEIIKAQAVDIVALCAHGFSGSPEQPFGSITGNLIDYGSTSLIIQQDMPAALPHERVAVSGRYAGVR